MIKFFISVTSHALNPPPSTVTNCHTFSDPSPTSVTYFMDGPPQNKRFNKLLVNKYKCCSTLQLNHPRNVTQHILMTHPVIMRFPLTKSGITSHGNSTGWHRVTCHNVTQHSVT